MKPNKQTIGADAAAVRAIISPSRAAQLGTLGGVHMNVRWDTFTLPNGRTHPQIHVSDSSDWGLFERLAVRLEDELEGRWVETLDGLDQRFWDLETEHGRLTLHLEHQLGITLHAAQGSSSSASRAMLEKAFEVLVSYDPA